ncbi:MAG: CoA-binding protein [bacterium]
MQKVINDFIADKHVAIVGVSRHKQKWGSMLSDMLVKKGYTVYPVNPKATEINGVKCYASIKDLPENVQSAIIATPREATELIMKDLPGSNIKRVWLQKGAGKHSSESLQAIADAKSNGVEVVYGFCPMMFYEGGAMHGTHLFFRKLIGNVPQEYKNKG